MPANAIENRMLDALGVALAGISVANGYLTDPVAAEGIPQDVIPKPTSPLVYYHHVRSERAEADAGTSEHRYRLHFTAYIYATTLRGVLDAKADVLRAVYANEAATAAVAVSGPMWPDTYALRDDMVQQSGSYCGVLDLLVDVEVSHATP